MTTFVDENRLKKLCKLARIEINSDEIQKYLKLINADLDTLKALENIDVSDLEELTNPYDMSLREYPDIVNDGNKINELMECSPKELYNYFVVPKVIGGE